MLVGYLPIVALKLAWNVLVQKRWMKEVLPTPESPTNTTLKSRSGALLVATTLTIHKDGNEAIKGVLRKHSNGGARGT